MYVREGPRGGEGKMGFFCKLFPMHLLVPLKLYNMVFLLNSLLNKHFGNLSLKGSIGMKQLTYGCYTLPHKFT